MNRSDHDDVNSDSWPQNHRLHRQIGLVDQPRLEAITVALKGDSHLILSAIIQLQQMHACTRPSGGKVHLDIDSGAPLDWSLGRWCLHLPEQVSTWGDLRDHLAAINGPDLCFGTGDVGTTIRFSEGVSEQSVGAADLHYTLWDGRAMASAKPARFSELWPSRPTCIDESLRIAIGAHAAQMLLEMEGLIRKPAIQDQWLTQTLRVEGLEPDEAIRVIRSEYGNPTATRLPDGSGSLVRIRIPLEDTPPEMLRGIGTSCHLPNKPEQDWYESIGPLRFTMSEGEILPTEPASIPPERIEKADIVVLGVGGLGSWATPCLIQGISHQGIHLSLVDSDMKVDAHNLNRQVLYSENHVGQPKASAAAMRLAQLSIHPSSLTAIHDRLGEEHIRMLETPDLPPTDEGDVDLSELVGTSSVIDRKPLLDALERMDIALACLDNQFARTILNRACKHRHVVMVNGGGETFEGIVETFGDEVCMECRYGMQEALSKERISCQEVGTRPVASIVTTTAWVGAMQAAYTLLLLCEIRTDSQRRTGLRWSHGNVAPIKVVSLPWKFDHCQ